MTTGAPHHSPSSEPALRGSDGRLDSIDALRGVAAVMVALFHAWGLYGIYPFPSIGYFHQDLSGGLFALLVSPLRWGYLGVSLFLVLSGFCIHLPFVRRRARTGDYQFAPREFLLRRLWRLYPAYAVSVVATFLLITVTAPMASRLATTGVAPSHTFGDLISHLFLIHGFFDQYFYSIAHVYWSLALELQLYLVYPLLLWLIRRLGITRTVTALTVLSIAYRMVALGVFHHQLISIAADGPFPLMGNVLARWPEWLFGAWLAEWYVTSTASLEASQAMPPRSWLVTSAIGVSALAISTTLSESLWSLTDPLFGIVAALVVAASIRPSHRAPEGTSSTLVQRLRTGIYRGSIWLGTISYTIYLFHDQLSWFFKPLVRRVPGAEVELVLRFVVFGLTIPIMAVIFRLVERPFLKPPAAGSRLAPIYARLSRAIGL